MAWHFHGLDHEDLGKAYDSRLVRRLWKWVQPYRRELFASIALMVLVTGQDILLPWLFKKGIDGPLETGDMHALWLLGGLMISIVVISFAAKGPQIYLQQRVGEQVIRDVRHETFAHLQQLSLDFYEKNKAGKLISRLTNDIDAIGQLLREGVVTLVIDTLMVTGVLVVMFYYSWRLTLAVLLISPLLALLTRGFRDRARRAYRNVRRKIAEIADNLQESIAGVRATHSFHRHGENIRRFDQTNIENLGANMHAATVWASFTPLVETVGAAGIGIVIWYGGVEVLRDAIELGTFVMFMMYVQKFLAPLINLSQLYNVFQAGMAGCERIFQLLDTEPTVKEAPQARSLNGAAGHFRFEAVTFEYRPGEPVLHDLDLEIRPGESVALVGPTGAGKTTISNLTARLYDPTRGRITLDGSDLRDIRFDSLRPLMAFVPQEPFLFTGTVRDNIRYGRLDATDGEVEAAARVAHAHEVIMRLPDGYDTRVEERGGNLSMGQRQLLALARALLADPRILILDEATSSVDTYTEHKLQEGIRALLHGRTSLIIAHRLSTVRHVDRVLVLDQGRIVEEGTHADLLRNGGLYRTLYEMQFRDLPAQPATADTGTN